MAMRTETASMIGVTAHFKCSECGAQATTHQLVRADDPSLDLPAGWTQRKGHTYCPAPCTTNLVLKERPQ